MGGPPTTLAIVWFIILGFILALYVVLDGFDLGVGILSLFSRREGRRTIMMTSLASVWDANEVWLVIWGAALFGAFPAIYGLVLSALYVPITLLLVGLIFRGIAFEFRGHSKHKEVWSLSFGLGSLMAAAAQGCILGGVLSGIRVDEAGRFAGGVFDWVTPFTGLIVVGVVFGYSMLGAAYLILKTTGDVRSVAYKWARVAALLAFIAAAVTAGVLPLVHSRVAAKWTSRPDLFWLGGLTAAVAFAFVMLQVSVRRGQRLAPFVWSVLVFLPTLSSLWLGLYPEIVPGVMGIGQAASPDKTLGFMLAVIGVMIPVVLLYNGYMYIVLRGEVGEQSEDPYAE